MKGKKETAPFHKYLHTAIIKGYGAFPLDMLRHDSAWPASETDAGLIVQTFHELVREAGKWEVKIQKRSWKKEHIIGGNIEYRVWAEDRWYSFNCKVEPVSS